MKKFLCVMCIICVSHFALAGQILWGNTVAIVDDSSVNIPDASTWILRMYESTDTTIDFALGAPTGNDSYTTIEFAWNSAGAPGYFALQRTGSDAGPYNVNEGDYVYSVLFNASTYAAATLYVVIDDTIATAAYTAGDFTYDPGGTVAGDWAVVPEPGTFALFGLGLLTIAARKRLRK